MYNNAHTHNLQRLIYLVVRQLRTARRRVRTCCLPPCMQACWLPLLVVPLPGVGCQCCGPAVLIPTVHPIHCQQQNQASTATANAVYCLRTILKDLMEQLNAAQLATFIEVSPEKAAAAAAAAAASQAAMPTAAAGEGGSPAAVQPAAAEAGGGSGGSGEAAGVEGEGEGGAAAADELRDLHNGSLVEVSWQPLCAKCGCEGLGRAVLGADLQQAQLRLGIHCSGAPACEARCNLSAVLPACQRFPCLGRHLLRLFRR